MRVVNVDPRRTATCDLADMHLRVLPDGDVALFNGLLQHLDAHDLIDTDYVTKHVNGFEAALTAAGSTSPEESGVPKSRT